jgi:hypothetical protein
MLFFICVHLRMDLFTQYFPQNPGCQIAVFK